MTMLSWLLVRNTCGDHDGVHLPVFVETPMAMRQCLMSVDDSSVVGGVHTP
jgi:hypothetical protein